MRIRAGVAPGWLCLSMCVFFASCQRSGPELAEVAGTVTYGGVPLPRVEVTFNPEAEGTSSYGLTDDQGKYRLDFTRDRSGAMVGWSRVALNVPALPAEIVDQLKARNIAAPRGNVHNATKLRELSTSGLRYEVQSGKNVIDIEIPTE